MFDLKRCKFVKELHLNFDPSILNSVIYPQKPRLTFLAKDVVLMNLPTQRVKEFLLIKFNDKGEVVKQFRVENTSNRAMVWDIDWSRNMLEVRYDRNLTERFYGMELETNMKQYCSLTNFRNWRDNLLKLLGS